MNTVHIPRPEHPEPMMQRAAWQNLNGQWAFYIDHGDSGKNRKLFEEAQAGVYDREITVPFCPESKLSGIAYTDFMRRVWYRRTVTLTKEQLQGRVLLHFGAVDYECDAYVNGQHVGNHRGGYSSFVFDITDAAKEGENALVVTAYDNLRELKQPSGKQSYTYESQGCYYTRTTGIWQTVWLEFVPQDYICGAKYFPDIHEGFVDVELTLTAPGTVTAAAFYEGKLMGKVTKSTLANPVRLRLPLDELHLWEVGQGRLYDLTLTLETEKGKDTVQSYFGMREVALKGFKFYLNDKVLFQRTVLDQGFYPDGIYTAPSDEALKRDVEMSMELGFNGARLHEKIFEPRFLYHCDKLGYLVWGEHANWGMRFDTDEALQHFLPEWLEAVKRDFNHPAIIGWCPTNEVWQRIYLPTTLKLLQALYEATKAADSTRPVIDASGGHHSYYTDLFDVHNYTHSKEELFKCYGAYDGTRESFGQQYGDSKGVFHPNLPLYVSEFGGISWVRRQDKEKLANENVFMYGQLPEEEESFFSCYEGLVTALLDCPNVMGFCYTQLYDVEQERNGLYTYDREKKFADYSRVYAANTRKARIEESEAI